MHLIPPVFLLAHLHQVPRLTTDPRRTGTTPGIGVPSNYYHQTHGSGDTSSKLRQARARQGRQTQCASICNVHGNVEYICFLRFGDYGQLPAGTCSLHNDCIQRPLFANRCSTSSSTARRYASCTCAGYSCMSRAVCLKCESMVNQIQLYGDC
jgi:hypothetical protein